MDAPHSTGNPVEQTLVKLYMDLTGLPESTARSVYMFVCTPAVERNGASEAAPWGLLPDESTESSWRGSPQPGLLP